MFRSSHLDRFVTDYARRDFLALSALGILGMIGRAKRSPDSDTLYVGTYTEGGGSDGIYLVRMDRRTGTLRIEAAVNAGPNPSFLALHPTRNMLYAVNETASGTVTALAVEASGAALTRIGQHASGGDSPCFVSVDHRGRLILVANYGSGTVAAIPLAANGALGDPMQVDQHRGKGPNAERQDGPHAHCIVADPTNRFALSADLGADRVLVYRLGGDPGLAHESESDGVLRPGAGPRHLAFHPRLPFVYVANELDSTVSALHWNGERGALAVGESWSTVPRGWSGANYPADIHLDSLGSTLYVSNRGHNSIAVFAVAEPSGALTQAQIIPTEGDWPRNFSLDPLERWLLVANERSGNVVVFARDPRTGRLALTSNRLAISRPVCLRFQRPAASPGRP